MRLNCWEFMDCGRAPGSPKEKTLGKCPAATYTAFRGVNGGFISGRYCWYVAGSLQDGKIHCTSLDELPDCLACEFFNLVKREEGERFQI